MASTTKSDNRKSFFSSSSSIIRFFFYLQDSPELDIPEIADEDTFEHPIQIIRTNSTQALNLSSSNAIAPKHISPYPSLSTSHGSSEAKRQQSPRIRLVIPSREESKNSMTRSSTGEINSTDLQSSLNQSSSAGSPRHFGAFRPSHSDI